MKSLDQIGRPRIADSVHVWFRVTSVLFAANSRISRGRINPGCEVCTNDSISDERSRSRNCAFDACPVSHFSSLSHLSYSLPYRIRSLFVRLPAHLFLSSFHLFIFYLIPRPYGFVPILSSILCTRLLFILLTSSNLARAHRTQKGYKMGRWVEGQKLEKRSCKTQRGRRERHGCIAVRHNAHRLPASAPVHVLPAATLKRPFALSFERETCAAPGQVPVRRKHREALVYVYQCRTLTRTLPHVHAYAHAIQYFELSKTELYRLDCIAVRPP